MIILTGAKQTLTSFCFTAHIVQYLRTENNYTLFFRLDDNTEDFVNMLDVADELGMEPVKPSKEYFYMQPKVIDPNTDVVIKASDLVLPGFAVQYDVSKDTVTLNVTYLDNTAYQAVMMKIGKHMEVSSSNMPVDVLYKMKFIVERNEQLVMSEWSAKHKRRK